MANGTVTYNVLAVTGDASFISAQLQMVPGDEKSWQQLDALVASWKLYSRRGIVRVFVADTDGKDREEYGFRRGAMVRMIAEESR